MGWYRVRLVHLLPCVVLCQVGKKKLPTSEELQDEVVTILKTVDVREFNIKMLMKRLGVLQGLALL